MRDFFNSPYEITYWKWLVLVALIAMTYGALLGIILNPPKDRGPKIAVIEIKRTPAHKEEGGDDGAQVPGE